MVRSVFQLSAACLAGAALILMIMMFGFFASPSAVRTSPPSVFSTILFNHLQQ
ncbi:hypothetical protein [Ruegeria sp. HKCCSP351]|uniref:hypothetical protein n=1 Tax=Ruegeria sp. HKCCSP351 TaxID=2794832 RepID=UPI001AEB5ED6|nr:hypothetical protein [Ruegeria sp. HKCCSP351]